MGPREWRRRRPGRKDAGVARAPEARPRAASRPGLTSLGACVTDCQHRSLEANGIRVHIAEQGTGPLVLLCHGFPESWYSWRHQLSALATAGYRAVAPDMRGYGQTDRPEGIEQYTLLHMAGDMVGPPHGLGVARG